MHSDSCSGSVCVIYKFENKWICVEGNFGSCSDCDFWKQMETDYNRAHCTQNIIKMQKVICDANDELNYMFDNAVINDDIDDVVFSCKHPRLIRELEEFKILHKLKIS